MKGKSKTGGGKISVKKPTSAKERTNLRQNIGRNQPQANQKKDVAKKDQKKLKAKDKAQKNK